MELKLEFRFLLIILTDPSFPGAQKMGLRASGGPESLHRLELGLQERAKFE